MAAESSTTDILLVVLGILIAALGYLLSRLLSQIDKKLEDMEGRIRGLELAIYKSKKTGSDVLPISGGQSA